MRLIPIVPFSIVCYAAGAARVPLWRFVWTTAVGYLPITAISVYFGTRLEGLSLTDPLVIGTAAGLLALLAGRALGDAAPGRRPRRALRPQPTRLTRKRKTAGGAVDVAGGVAAADLDHVPARRAKRRESRRPQKRSRPRSTLQTKVTPASLEREAEDGADAAAAGADQLRRVLGDATCGAPGVDREGGDAAAPARPARSTPLTAMPWVPSASAAGTANGEAQGCGAPPSIAQVKATGRLALNSIAGRRSRLERRRRLGDRDRRRQSQRGDGAVGVDQAGADGVGPEGADRARGRGQRGAHLRRRRRRVGLAHQRRDRGRVRRRRRGAAEAPDARCSRRAKKVVAPQSVAARSGLAIDLRAIARRRRRARRPGRSSA